MIPSLIFVMLAVGGSQNEAMEAFGTALAVIEHQESLIRSFDVQYSVDIEIREIGASDSVRPMLQRQSYTEQRRGDRFRRDFDLIPDSNLSNEIVRDLKTFDGGVHRAYYERSKVGVLMSEGMGATCVTQTIYFSDGGLGEVLSQHKDDAEVAWEEVDGERLLVVRWDENNGQSRRAYFLNPEAAYQPRRYTLESDYPDGYLPDGRKGGKYLGIVQEYVRQGAIVWPKVVQLIDDEIDANGREWRVMDKLTTIKSIVFNPELDDSLFTIDFPHGTRVNDVDRGVTYVVGEPESERPSNAVAPSEAAPVITTGPAYEFWADWRLWLASAGICGGLLIWLKKRGLA